jgi:hypothetical protein
MCKHPSEQYELILNWTQLLSGLSTAIMVSSGEINCISKMWLQKIHPFLYKRPASGMDTTNKKGKQRDQYEYFGQTKDIANLKTNIQQLECVF